MQARITMPQLPTPVPLNSLRLRKRGFNQAQFIAKGLSHLLNVNVNTRLYKRRGYQVSQQSQTRWKRQSSLREVFQVKKSEDNRVTNHIATIDDVMTTGATTQALSQSLIKAWNGPLEIQVWCTARTQSFNTKLNWYLT
jgi:ComF family protein